MMHFLIALAIALIAAAPLTYPGPLQTQAGVLHLFPISGMCSSPFCRLSLALESGGLSSLDVQKLWQFGSIVSGALGMFALARVRWGNAAALISSALYAFLPYRLMLLYVQGNDAESFFWGVLPWAFVVPMALAIWVRPRRTRRRLAMPLALAVGAVVAAVLWLLWVRHAPDPSQAQAYLFQLFSARWSDGTRGDWLDAVPMQLGIAPLGLTVAALAVRRTRPALVLTGIAAVCAALSVEPLSSGWAWDVILNVPWQLVGAAGFCLSLAGGSLLAPRSDSESNELPLLAAALTITLLASYPYLQTHGIDFTPTHSELARFDNGIVLLDAETSAPVQPGTTLTVTLIWQNQKPLDVDYHVFVHVLDNGDRLWAQRDRPPLEGARPTTTWRRGEVLRDPYLLSIPSDAPRDLHIAVGLYDHQTGTRVRVRIPQAADVFLVSDRVNVAGAP